MVNCLLGSLNSTLKTFYLCNYFEKLLASGPWNGWIYAGFGMGDYMQGFSAKQEGIPSPGYLQSVHY